jgi:hypothetical protein
MATPHAVVTTETSKSLPLITWGGGKTGKKAKTINVKKGRKSGEGVWLGIVSGLGTPDRTPLQTILI